ncbi:MAG: NYN domain-containing protein [bacterium]|nr:NYN domain-containing protein [bacterium]
MSAPTTLRLPKRRNGHTAGRQLPAVFSPRCGVIICDYENISSAVTKDARYIEWAKIKEFCQIEREIRVIQGAYVFLPAYGHSMIEIARECYNFGYLPLVCPKLPGDIGTKDKDTVDSIMISLAKDQVVDDERVTDLVIISNDGDFSRLVTSFQDRAKRVTLLGYGKISLALRQAAGPDNVFTVPTSEMKTKI